MPSFDAGGGARTPFGKNEFLRSTQDVKVDGFTMAKGGIPAETIDTYTDQKVLQPGTILARYTGGADAGKLGVFDRGTPVAAADEIQVLTGTTVTAGTYKIGVDDQWTEPIAFDANTAAIQSKINDLSIVDTDHTITVGGGPVSTTPVTLTFGGDWADSDQPVVEVDDDLLLTNEVQVLTRTSTGGTITLNVDGEVTATIPASAAGFTATAVQTAVDLLPNVDEDHTITVTGSAGGPLSLTYGGEWAGEDVPQVIVDNTLATGGTIVASTGTAGGAAAGTIAVTTQTAGKAITYTGGGSNGLNDPDNIVGIDQTFLPWQLMERDVEVGVVYEATVVQGWCFEYQAGVRIALTDETVAAMQANPNLHINFR